MMRSANIVYSLQTVRLRWIGCSDNNVYGLKL